jgi:hypothetical protein
MRCVTKQMREIKAVARQPSACASRLRVGDLCGSAFESAWRFHFVIQGGESRLAREQHHEPTRRRLAQATSALLALARKNKPNQPLVHKEYAQGAIKKEVEKALDPTTD